MDAERRLRVLITADTVGGVWPFAIELATQLTAAGDRVLLAAMGQAPSATQRQQARALDGLEFHARAYRLVWMRDPWHDLDEAAEWLGELAGSFAPDVIHLNDLALADRAWPAPVLLSAHSCVCSWWQAVHGESAPAEWNHYRECVGASLRSTDRVVAPSRAMLHALVAQHGPIASCDVIHNGRTPPSGMRATKEPFVLGAGRLWDEAKNLGALASIAQQLPWSVYLAGAVDHPDRGPAATLRAHSLGPLSPSRLSGWMARAWIYALPARYEPFGLSVLEAAQHGCALVLGDIPSLREVWGDAALFVDPDDPDALSAAILRLIHNDTLRSDMARRAGVRARRYDPSLMAARYRRNYMAMGSRASLSPSALVPDTLAGAAA
ncbi:glycosyltransferase family 4 protein [Lysobacter sp.]|uniref:glycosyltransferase family 4 protein n=1 Tax=Lysobacter sp. TaxID=72226 RepID=UPI002D3477D1|nr:glycosyltransferase family 4 protein [Lysobacter sp.]HZX78711.1 glycosyltransferase family 4 protein [Lysobacter sp.]